MSAKYRPDESALPGALRTTIHLANRDLAGLVPINFVTHAGVSLTSACFAKNTFEDTQAEKCISNLLAAQFQRFVVDLYWDSNLRQFTFCPVSIDSGSRDLNASSFSLTTAMTTSQTISNLLIASTSTNSPPMLEASQEKPTISAGGGAAHAVRDPASSNVENTSDTLTSNSESSTAVVAPSSTSISPPRVPLYGSGPYLCSSSVNLPFFVSLIMDYLDNTSYTGSANLLFLQFNMHAAAFGNASINPALSPSKNDMPAQTELIGNAFKAKTSSQLYQPSELLAQRANLNSSWYTVSALEQPASEYFITERLPSRHQSTPDGWPSENFAQLKQFNRLLLGWGSIDAQMEAYDFARDNDVVFPQNYLSSSTDVKVSTAGLLEAGCLYTAEQPTVEQANSSWALSILNTTTSSLDSSDTIWSLAGNMSACGITPTLDLTLGNQTADLNISAYAQFVQSTVWSWAPGEPSNVYVSNAMSKGDGTAQGQFRCALMKTSVGSNGGRWRVEDCEARHRAACRVNNQPYSWQLSDDNVPFAAAELACPTNSSFSAPRTGLENTYLYHHVSALPEASEFDLSDGGSGVWVNLNSLDNELCWVTTGPNGKCSYLVDESLQNRTVLVPVIAALVVLLLTALTLFVKCNKNRRSSRKRMRGEDGWDYEGVPS